jgi:endoglucanase
VANLRTLAAAAAIPVSVLVSAPAWAQNNPFPTSGHYAQGFVPSSVTTAVVQSSYANWKSTYLLDDCGSGYYRVDNATGTASTYSEGQGYGMVLTAYFGDKTAFDGLWAFAQHNFNGNQLMGWHVTCSGFTTTDGGSGSATDGDTDIGFALYVAAAQWGGTYAQQAQTYLTALQANDFTTCSPSGRNLPTDGDWQGSSACTAAGGGSNTSYWMPGYYRVFQALTGNSFWGKTADDVVTLYGLAADPTTGIIVDSADQNGVAVPGGTYDYNSCRIPWRGVLDYLWFGTSGSQQMVTNITNWANTVGIQNIVDGYNADGTVAGQYTGMNAFVGGFTAGAMGNSQSLVDSFSSYFVTIADDNGTYYGSSLRTLYLLELSGNQWNPMTTMGVASDAGAPAGNADAGTSGQADAGTSGQADTGTSSQADSGTSDQADAGGPGTDTPGFDGGADDAAAAQASPPQGSPSGASGGCAMAPGASNASASFVIAAMLGWLATRRRTVSRVARSTRA